MNEYEWEAANRAYINACKVYEAADAEYMTELKKHPEVEQLYHLWQSKEDLEEMGEGVDWRAADELPEQAVEAFEKAVYPFTASYAEENYSKAVQQYPELVVLDSIIQDTAANVLTTRNDLWNLAKKLGKG